MFEFLLAPENLPFSVALLVMVMIGAVEALGLGIGAAHLDVGAGDIDGPDWLDWLGVGRVPVLVLLVVLLAMFGMAGIAIQGVASSLAGAPLPLAFAAPGAFVAALPLTGIGARGLARVLPQDETTAVPLDSLVGKRGTITIGTARRGSAAQARVRDVHGHSHYVMVEPNDSDHPIGEGGTVLLVRREGDIFIGIGEADGLTPHVVLPAPRSDYRERIS